MTLLDAPVYDEAKERRTRLIWQSALGSLLVLFVAFWLVAGRPVDWPWHWYTHLSGRAAVNSFFTAVEKNDLETAYGIWTHDKNWQQHAAQHAGYPFVRFEKDWSPLSSDNEYGAIHSHKIVAARLYGNCLLSASLINGRKTKAINLEYYPGDHTLTFAPDDVRLEAGQ